MSAGIGWLVPFCAEKRIGKIAQRTPSDLSSSLSSSSSSFNLGSFHSRVSSFSSRSLLLVGESFTYPQILQAKDGFDNSKLMKKGQSGDLYLRVLESGLEVVVKKVSVSIKFEMEIHGIVIVNHPSQSASSFGTLLA
ncbi:OLC1v1009537C1 [Oldenlandia corymbosa var. corymbosa]|uniref:OLC1v1009537C1 n=1 Tax=Oldenlandia corymbosa var. corymbosa TaxID=529605 RepID=A0AAV1DRK7_OLDCO|nr:OLC1v1009537C1 [Oldenlandia corymbosa var. corymbosa]